MSAPLISQLNGEAFSAVRVRQPMPDPDAIVEIPQVDAFSIIVQLQDFQAHRLWRGRRLSYAGGYRQGAVSLPFMGDQLRCQHRSGYDNLRLILPRQTLDELQSEQGGKRVDVFRYDAGGAEDATLYHLAQALLPALQRPELANRLFLDHMLMAIATHSIERYGRVAPPSGRLHASLTAAQLAVAKELIAHHLDGELSVERIAQECSLTRSHFSRAFKQATGMAPHTWLLHRRVERAQALLRAVPPMPMAQIAQACGFADQPHMTRVFTRLVGEPPSAWRNRHQASVFLPR
ncbi:MULTISPECIES: AraC family transcriptional regulator [unclassified Pseudomonas]|uniref:AraC family transcriptional regulator n=1 Tax=unclassified Pseudomonas TaxID=196821 RepID=UPI000D35CBEC|nr:MULTISPECIES: AraC family transcriptional regulator [unclassified Pseudomonas]RAU41480.1 AraC family transcriptional regulator [Pseudomonas sp. RIT 409]RAU53303.1 AraC family transcriptional regulator [Pseudomonas sp. RIT 412]